MIDCRECNRKINGVKILVLWSGREFHEEPGKIRIVSDEDVYSSLPMKRVLEVCEEVLKWLGTGKIEQKFIPSFRTVTGLEKGCFLLPHPCWVKPLDVVGNKVSGASNINPSLGLRGSQGVVIIREAKTAVPFTIVDSGTITSIRTAGHAAIGAKYLAKKDSSVISIIGAGDQGRSHLAALNELFKLEEVKVYDVYKVAMEKYKEEAEEKYPELMITLCDNAKNAVKGTDIICTTAKVERPGPVKEEWVESGVHVCMIGGGVESEIIAKADKWVLGLRDNDLRFFAEEARSEDEFDKAGATASVWFEKGALELPDIVLGRRLGRETDEERTVCFHRGMGAWDTPVAYEAYRLAKEKGLGTLVTLYHPKEYTIMR